MSTLFDDLRYAVRRLSKSPSFAVTSIITLALGIGAVTAVFSVVNSIILRPYPFRDPGQLVIWRETIQEVSNRYPFIPDNYRHYLNLKTHATKIEDAAIFQDASFAVTVGKAHPEIVRGLSVSANFFSVLGSTPIVGRPFSPDEAQNGRNQGVILSWSAWRRLFNANPSVIGSSLKVGGESRIVEGVLPKNFAFPVMNGMPTAAHPGEVPPYEIFQPLVPQPDDLTADDSNFAFLVVARLKPGVTASEAGSELDGMQKSYSAGNHLSIHLGAIVEPLSRVATGNVSKALWLLLAAVSGVLLIACVNLASLQLARSVARDHENAVRAALGAGPSRLFRASLSESLVVSLIGGVSGVFFAFAGVRVFVAVAPANLPRLDEINVSWPVLLFAFGLSLLTAITFGVFPSLRSLRADPQLVLLQSGSPRMSGARKATATRRLLVAFEVACTVVLLIFTALVSRSFSRVLNQDRAFRSEHLIVAEVNLLNRNYNQGANSGEPARAAFVDRALARLRSTPGVEFAAITDNMPLTGENSVYSVYREDNPLPESAVPTANLRNITPDYFAAMQIPLVAGEYFGDRERQHPEDAIVSQKLAKAAWPAENPLGRKFRINGRTYTVAGIAADARIVDLKQSVPVVYLPYWHDPSPNVFFLVRSSLPLETLGPSVRSGLWDIDSEVAIPVIKSFDTQVSESVAADRFQALVLSCFSLAALMLAALGVYGVLAYSVSLRTQEFGVRIALGSSRNALMGLVLREASYPILGGLALGTIAALGTTRVIRSLLYETQAADPIAISASIALLIVVALVAGLLPAYRGSNSDPMRVLREQ
jgi:predicted permease